jgi:HAE1 family hydrophobic/amphiphilic exporter-1
MALSIVLFGFIAYRQLPVNDLPVVDYPVITVNANYPGASPQTMASSVATPLEKQFLQIPGIELITSASNQGSTNLTLQFALDKSLGDAASDVQAAIQAATGQLPSDLPSPPSLRKVNPNDQPILYIVLKSNVLPPGQIYQYAATNIAQPLGTVNGVSQVNVFGVKPAIRIQADPRKLAAVGLTMTDLSNAIKKGTIDQAAGQIDGPDKTFVLEPNGQLETAAEYNNLIVATVNGLPVYLRDVATAVDSVQDIRQVRRYYEAGAAQVGEAQTGAVVMAVFRQLGSNTVEVAQQVKDRLPQLRATLPKSLELAIMYDRSKLIVDSIDDVQVTLLIAFALVVIVIFVFLGRARDTLVPAVALPLSLLITFLAMRALGYSLDNLSLMGLTLAIGFLVDDAIVFLENTVRRMEHGEDPLTATLNGAREISFTIVSMTISLAVVFLPLVLMPGIVGRVFREFAVTIIVAIFASGFVSLTVTPMMCARTLGARTGKKTWMERLFEFIERPVLNLYGKSLWFFIRHRWISAILWVICLAITYSLLINVPKGFLPPGDSGFIRGVFQAAQGTSPEQMRQYQLRIEEVLAKDPAYEKIYTNTGGASPVPGQGVVLGILKPRDQRDRIDIVAQRMARDINSNIPGLRVYPRGVPVLQISTGAVSNNQGQYAYTLSGVNPDEVYASAQRLNDKLKSYPGFLSLTWDYFPTNPTLAIDIRRDQASKYGVSLTTILNTLKNAYSLNYSYQIRKPDDIYQVIVEVDPALRRTPEDLGRIYVKSDDGTRTIPLNALIDWKPTTEALSVNHLNQFTAVSLFFNLKPGVNVGDAVAFVERAARESNIPPSVTASLQGEAQTFQKTIASLGILMVLAVFVMYVILGVLYESYLHPLTVLSSLPVALVGGVGALYLLGLEANLYAYVGMFMLMGIIKKNGIMIVDFARQRVDSGIEANQAIHDASIDRFRPIMMTTLAAAVGALPIALGYGADGDSRRPLGVVIVAGLAVAQLITLYITPAIYLYFEQLQESVLDRTSFFRHARHLPGDLATTASPTSPPLARIAQPLDASAADTTHAHTNGNNIAGPHSIGS